MFYRLLPCNLNSFDGVQQKGVLCPMPRAMIANCLYGGGRRTLIRAADKGPVGGAPSIEISARLNFQLVNCEQVSIHRPQDLLSWVHPPIQLGLQAWPFLTASAQNGELTRPILDVVVYAHVCLYVHSRRHHPPRCKDPGKTTAANSSVKRRLYPAHPPSPIASSNRQALQAGSPRLFPRASDNDPFSPGEITDEMRGNEGG